MKLKIRALIPIETDGIKFTFDTEEVKKALEKQLPGILKSMGVMVEPIITKKDLPTLIYCRECDEVIKVEKGYSAYDYGWDYIDGWAHCPTCKPGREGEPQ